MGKREEIGDFGLQRDPQRVDMTSAALSAGILTIGDIGKAVFGHFGALVGDAFLSGLNLAIGAINKLASAAASGINGLIMGANGMLGTSIGMLKAPQLGQVANPYARACDKAFGNMRAQADKRYADELARNQRAFAGIRGGSIQSAEDRMNDEANAIGDNRRARRGRNPREKKEAVDHADHIIARLDEQILSAKEKLAGTAEKQAAFALLRIDTERKKTVLDALSLVKQGKITEGEEKHIKLQANVLAELKKQEVLRVEQTKLLTQQQAAQDQLFGSQTDALKAADSAASSQADHRKIQLEMLDIAYQQKEFDLQILESKQKLAGDLAAAALTQGQIDHLPTEKAYDQAQTLRNTADPLKQWFDKIPNDAKTITEALQAIEVHGLDSLASRSPA